MLNWNPVWPGGFSSRQKSYDQKIKKVKLAKKTEELETEGKNPKNNAFRTNFWVICWPNKSLLEQHCRDRQWFYTHGTHVRYNDNCGCKFWNSTSGRRQKEYKNIEFLWKQRPGVGGMIALPLLRHKYRENTWIFWVTKAIDRQHVNLERLMLALTRLRDFLIERPDLAILASLWSQ